MSSSSSLTTPGALAPSARPTARRSLGRTGTGTASPWIAAVAYAALAVAVGATAWLATAAAQRASTLSPPSSRADVPWLYGPLQGLLPRLSHDPARLHRDHLIALVLLFAAWLVAWAAARAISTAAAWITVVLVSTVTVLGPPQSLTDLFNYLSYGRMTSRGVNPYAVAPAGGSPHDLLYHLSNWHHLRSPYGPLSTLLSEPFGLMPVPTAYIAWKAFAVLTFLGALGLVAWLARALDRSVPQAIIAVGLCPATLALGLGGFHNDPPAMVAVLGALACVVQARRTGKPAWSVACGALVVIGCGIKPSFAVVVAPLVLAAPHRWRAAAGAAAAGAVVGLLVLTVFGGLLPDVRVQGSLVSPLSLPNLLGALAGRGGADATVRSLSTVVIALASIAAALYAWRRPDRVVGCCAAVLLVSALALSWGMPWYVGWALPFVALGRSRALVGGVIFATVLLGVGGLPQAVDVIHAFGYVPSHNPVGLQNHLRVLQLVR